MSGFWARWTTRLVGFFLAAFVFGAVLVQWVGVEPTEPDSLEMSDVEDAEQDLDEKMFGAPLALPSARTDTARVSWLQVPEPDCPAEERLLRPPRA